VAWELERPDLNEWAQAQHDMKAALEEQYLEHKQDVLLSKRQDRRSTLRDRMRDRMALEAEAGQVQARRRDLARRQQQLLLKQQAEDETRFLLKQPVWRPS